MDWITEIKRYTPCNEQEEKDKAIILDCIKQFDNILTRENKIAHITSSGFIVNKMRDSVLMIHHNIYNAWAWTGGHADGEMDLLAVAIREAQEETGVKNIHPVATEIISLDILPVLGHVKRGAYVSSHLHLSVAYLVEADEEESLIVKIDENSGVKWIPIAEIDTYTNEPHMQKVYKKIVSKMKALRI
ncbi:8-oxo-dGTP pyrophosphatase MutT (NUDIX family) [Anaerosolibacter carboniphilus]|uniref:8-oxo-dGTP pyrophosphatase MutT (NUDIX family) n=1 Tax=Anaerosolibacter carboniphilus TaxID=1417629 RepID=A0A841KU99_9FIRM|nr:NUDIX hydrolase [Anaerosolibacter carboniphilus]MBB6217186.1 8-oxo-dGTP pyrophosphatase MutT (NUDIX family) [Anaerosolibacter carboniphilus]